MTPTPAPRFQTRVVGTRDWYIIARRTLEDILDDIELYLVERGSTVKAGRWEYRQQPKEEGEAK